MTKSSFALGTDGGRRRKRLLIAGAIAAAVLVVVLAIYFYGAPSTSEQAPLRADRAADQMRALSESIQDIFKDDADRYGKGADITALVIAKKGAPSDLVEGDGLVGVWGGQVNVVGGLGTFQIYYRNVPTDACIAMAQHPPSATGELTGNGAPIASVADASVACGSPGNANNVIWTSK